MALRIGYGGPVFEGLAEQALLDTSVNSGVLHGCTGWGWNEIRLFPYAVNYQLRTGADKGNPTV